MQFQRPPNTPDIVGQVRRIGYGFVAGLIVGVLIGWFFHGVVSLFVRFGLLLVLLVPLVLIGLFLWRSRRSSGGNKGSQGQPEGMRVYTWSSEDRQQRPEGPAFRRAEPEHDNRQSEEEIIDLEFEELKRDVDEEKKP